MRALVVYCHPNETSFNAGIRDLVLEKLQRSGAETRLIDLYAEGFQPVMPPDEWTGYMDTPANRTPVEDHCAAVQWCDTLIFVYPTWWYGMPAMLKGWLDRVMLPDVAFIMPTEGQKAIRPGLQHIRRLGVFTTCGASWWLTRWIGAPGRRTLLRGLGVLLHPRARKYFAAHYRMDDSTAESRARHLARVAAKMDRLVGAPRREAAPQGQKAPS
ncbi:MAG: NAD(P)H-dependent oxidoreductase [Pseudomonadota bacterium]